MGKGIDLTWPGGEHHFALSIDLLRALEDKCDAGPAWILARLSDGKWRVNDVTETIRLGLEGGGMEKTEARKLAKRHVEDAPLTEFVLTAQAILMAALYTGREDEDEGEPKTGEASSSPAENSPGQTSTNGAASGDGTSAS